jgi:hypothetical protein
MPDDLKDILEDVILDLSSFTRCQEDIAVEVNLETLMFEECLEDVQRIIFH